MDANQSMDVPVAVLGWVNDPQESARAFKAMGSPYFGQLAGHLVAADEDRTFLISDVVKKVLGAHLPAQQQPRGTCVSRGYSRGLDYKELVLIAAGLKVNFRAVSHAVVYGLGKEIGGDLGPQNNSDRNDGLVGAWAAQAVSQIGNAFNDDVGDVDAGSDKLAIQFAVSGVPADIKAKCKDHTAGVSALVTTPEEARAALVNGNPVAVCSDQGFEDRPGGVGVRDANGRCAPRGTWNHCVMPDAMIAGPVYRRADAVRVGDTVYGHDGEVHKVTEVHRRQFSGTSVRIKASGIPAVTYTDEHPVLVYRRARRVHGSHRLAKLAVGTSVAETDADTHYAASERYEPAWVCAKDVRPGDRVVTPKLAASEPIAPEWVRPNRGGHLLPVQPCDDLAWLFGFYAGDGHADEGHRVTLTLSLKDPVERIIQAFALLGVRASVEENPTYRRVVVNNAALADSFIEWFGGNSSEKRLPDWLMTWNASAILDGIVQADGCEYKGRRIFTSVSPVLAEQVRMLVIATGDRPSVTVKQPGKGAYANGRPQRVVNWTPGGSDRKVTNAAGFAMYVVKSVLLVPHEGEVFNYEVEDCHSYVADGVAVHNCMVWTGYRADRKQFLVEQSWGPNAPAGPLGDLDIPTNAFWIDWQVAARMLSQRDSFAIQTFNGWQPIPEQLLRQYI